MPFWFQASAGLSSKKKKKELLEEAPRGGDKLAPCTALPPPRGTPGHPQGPLKGTPGHPQGPLKGKRPSFSARSASFSARHPQEDGSPVRSSPPLTPGDLMFQQFASANGRLH